MTYNSEYTKLRIVNTAYDLFGRIGYSETTMRMIASEAGVSLSSLPYYFKNKENLLNHVILIALTELENSFNSIKEKTEAYLSGKEHNLDEARSLLFEYLDRHIDYVFNQSNDKQLRFFFQLRSSQDCPRIVGDTLRNMTMAPMCKLLAILKPNTHQKVTEILAYSIIGEQLFFFYHKPSVLAQLGAKEFDAKTVQLIRKTFTEKLEAILK